MDAHPSTAAISAELTRAEGLWFEDCGLIIQAETTLFRVSRDILAIQSSVFGDMLSLPTPQDAEMMEGCPFVRLPDTAEDVTSFLKAVFYYDYFESFPGPTTFPVLSSVLRMSHKYEVDALRKRALGHLSSACPTRLDDWDRLDDPDYRPSWRDDRKDWDLPIVKLAHQLGAIWLLPTTFYRISHSSHERAIITSSHLSDSDKINFLQGLRYLETTGAAEVLDFLWGPYNCSASRCSASRLHVHRELERRRGYHTTSPATMPLELVREVHWGYLGVCSTCRSAMKDAHRNARKALWNKLPELFGLPNWTQLERLKADALR
ncbi:hypothetical protein B0H19DRAFT_1004121 [Mycena capillaripes]|nr:hypothetical protein B0H19DRAFT_1004121 [Mycena capillaripes]